MPSHFSNVLHTETPTVVFVESRHGVESLFTRLLRHGARQAGWKYRVVTLRDAQGRRLLDGELRDAICSGSVDLIAFLMDAPLGSAGLWKSAHLHDIPKISLWYDDYLRSPDTLAHPDVWRHWQQNDHVTTFIWDGHWRAQWESFTHHPALPIHLSADPEQFSPDTVSVFPELHAHAIFTGTIPALAALNDEAHALPVPVRNYLNTCVATLEKAPWPLQPYEVAAAERAALAPKIVAAIDQWLLNPAHQALFNHQVWHWSKRIARLRGLAAVMKSGPVAVVSGHHTARFAGEAELRAALHADETFQFRNTTDIEPKHWAGIFRSGRFQLQFTDPQSIEGGLPFRVFECAASGATLLSDTRPELAAEFKHNEEIVLATDEDDLTRRAHDLFKADADMLVSIGTAALDKFRQKHTCGQRWREIILKHHESLQLAAARHAAPPALA